MVVIFNFLLWVLLTLLAWDHRQLRGTVKRLKARIDRLEQPTTVAGEAGWGYYGDDDDGDGD